MTVLPEPSFIDRDPEAIRDAVIARVEALLNQSLPPQSTERMMCEVLAYRETLVRIAIQLACKQNLWSYANYPMIDHLARIVGEARRVARAATTTMLWTLPVARESASPIPMGTTIRSKDGKVIFATDKDATIPTGDLSVTVSATCTTTGVGGNGYLAGQVSELVSQVAFTVAASNTTITAGGTTTEGTEAMRERVPLSIETLSVAGPLGAYERLACTVDGVLDARALQTGDGEITVTVLGDLGEPDQDTLDAVVFALDPEDAIPETDEVIVEGALPVLSSMSLGVTLYKPQAPRTAEVVVADIVSAVSVWAAKRGTKLGRGWPWTLLSQQARAVPELFEVVLQSTLPVVGDAEYVVLESISVMVLGYTEEDD